MDPVMRSVGNRELTLSSLEADVLIATYNSLLDKLEPLCVQPPSLSHESLLWFHPDEVEGVNTLWRAEGLAGVIRTWGDERRGDQFSPGGGDDLVYLHIVEDAPAESSDERQAHYFRQRSFQRSASFESEFVEAFRSTGLQDQLVPEYDSISGSAIRSAAIRSVDCSVHWYGPNNMYGNGSEINVNMELTGPPSSEVTLRVSFMRDAHVHVCLFDPRLSETGYEGHDHKIAPITYSALRGLLPVLSKVAEMKPVNPTRVAFGAWRGDSLPLV